MIGKTLVGGPYDEALRVAKPGAKLLFAYRDESGDLQWFTLIVQEEPVYNGDGSWHLAASNPDDLQGEMVLDVEWKSDMTTDPEHLFRSKGKGTTMCPQRN